MGFEKPQVAYACRFAKDVEEAMIISSTGRWADLHGCCGVSFWCITTVAWRFRPELIVLYMWFIRKSLGDFCEEIVVGELQCCCD